MTKITALIITLNEEKHIAACLDSLAGVADEVLVIDSFSVDKTKQIAEAKGAKVIEEIFIGFGQQRNLGCTFATNDMILVLDADERLSQELKQTIVSTKESSMATAYTFNRLNFIGSRAIRAGAWYPDPHVRMYNRTKAKWNERKVHEGVEVNGEIKFLKGDLLHYSYENIEQLKGKSTRYARLGATVYKDRNPMSLLLNIVFSPIAKFCKIYFIHRGFTEGYMGLLISYYRARETFLKYYWALV